MTRFPTIYARLPIQAYKIKGLKLYFRIFLNEEKLGFGGIFIRK